MALPRSRRLSGTVAPLFRSATVLRGSTLSLRVSRGGNGPTTFMVTTPTAAFPKSTTRNRIKRRITEQLRSILDTTGLEEGCRVAVVVHTEEGATRELMPLLKKSGIVHR